MALPETPLSKICAEITHQVSDFLKTSEYDVRVGVGSPSGVAPSPSDTEHHVSLFFYRFEPAVGVPNMQPGDPLWLRVHCIISAFAAPEEQRTAGENDLRIIGMIMQFFHEHSSFHIEIKVPGPTGSPPEGVPQLVAIDMIPAPLSLDDINRLWSTQREVAYRPSVAYEVALVPVLPDRRPATPRRVGSVHGVGEWNWPVAKAAKFAVPFLGGSVNLKRLDWTPLVCLVDLDKSEDPASTDVRVSCSQTISFLLGSEALLSWQPAVLVAGVVDNHSQLFVRWETWDAQNGWQCAGSDVPVPKALTTIEPDKLSVEQVRDARIPLGLPMGLSGQGGGQAMLYVVRKMTNPLDPTQKQVEIRSNPLLVTVFVDDLKPGGGG